MPGKSEPLKLDQDEHAKLSSSGMTNKSINAVFACICLATAVRSCEAGIVGAMMEDIQLGLGLSLGFAGQVASAPDYGLVPGALVATCVLQRATAHHMLTISLFTISTLMLVCAAFPSGWSLVLVRACNGFFWGLVAVHCPAWINKFGPAEKRTNWMGYYNASLLIGILIGYSFGAYSTRFWLNEVARWTLLYIGNALCMLGCALWCYMCIAPGLVQVVDFEAKQEDSERKHSFGVQKPSWFSRLGLPREWSALCASRIYVASVLFSGCIAGASAFILYFVAQLLFATFASWDQSAGFAAILAVMVTAPLPGNLLGACFLSYLGGYQNRSAAFTFMMGAMCFSFISLMALFYAAVHEMATLCIVSFYLFLFLSAAPASAIHGLAVNAVPEAATHAAGFQCAVQNTAKMIVPAVGGIAMDWIGVVNGFFFIVGICNAAAVISAAFGYVEAQRQVDGEMQDTRAHPP